MKVLWNMLLISVLVSCRTDPEPKVPEVQRPCGKENPTHQEGGCPPGEKLPPKPIKGQQAPSEAYQQELRVLRQSTPRVLDWSSFSKEFGYDRFPSEIFARKGGVMTPEERQEERTPPGTTDSAAHRFLMQLGQQIFQQALLSHLAGDVSYADNAVSLLRALVDARLRFKNDPKNPSQVNDNRFLEMAWFLSLSARGAHILDETMSAEWKDSRRWASVLKEFQTWIGSGIDQNWPMEQALQKSPLDLIAQPGLLNWVTESDWQRGATNRTFASLEAQMRVAELRQGTLGPVRLVANAWQQQQGSPLVHEGKLSDLFGTFRSYLHYYFNRPLARRAGELSLKYDPNRTLVNSDPELLDQEVCGDPLQLGYNAMCLLNKDAYRNDTFHAQMGFASVLNIIDIGRRNGLLLSPYEEEKVIMGLRWTSFNNVDGVTGKPAHGIPVWELAFRFYSEEALGPYCKRDLEADRRDDSNKDMAIAWGYSLLAEGF